MRIRPASDSAVRRRLRSACSSPCAAPLAVCAALGVVGAFAAGDYGVSLDQERRRLMAVRAVDYVLGKNDDMLHDFDRVMGVAFEAPLHLAELALGLEDSRSMLLARHLLSHWFFLLGGFSCALLAHRLTGSRAASVFALLLFLLHPRLYAHSFINTKDIPFASMFMVSLHASWRAFDRSTWRSFALAGAAAGALSSMRIMGLMLVAGVAALQLRDAWAAGGKADRRRGLAAAGAFLGASAVVLYATWPYLWADPLGRIAEAIATAAAHPSAVGELTSGRQVFAYDVPFRYVPAWFSVTTPPTALALGFLGTGVVLGRGTRRPAEAARAGTLRFQLFLVACVAVPLLVVFVLRPTLFNGWRHLYFIYAPFALLAALGLHFTAVRLRSRTAQAAVYVAVGLGLAFTAAAMVRIHPYQHVYFNAFVDKESPERLAEQYEMDYWKTTYREGLEFLLSRHPGRQIHVQGTFGESMSKNSEILAPAQRERLTINGERADFVVAVYVDRGRSGWRPVFGPVLHSRKLYNSTMMEVAEVALPDSARAAPYREAYESIARGTPVARSGYDIYLDDGGLAYLKEPCEAGDARGFLVVHVVPVDASDLPAHRQLHGYLNPSAPFGRFGVRFGDRCLMRVPLPGFEIARVRTGMRGRGTWAWETTIERAALAPPGRGRRAAAPKRRRQAEASRTARRNASIMEEGSAVPEPAMSKAVPWSGDVRTKGRPMVVLTPRRKAAVLKAAMPTSW